MAAWDPEGTSVQVHGLGDVPMRLERVDLPTGERTPRISIGPAGKAGLVSIQVADRVLGPGRRIAHPFQRGLSTLFMVEEVER